MKRRHLLLMALSLILSICMCFGLAACSSCDDDDAPAKLSTPVVTIDNTTGVASWLEVEHASGYAYVIGDGAETATTKLSVTLTDGQTIKVKAKGDGANYSDSDFSEVKTYTASAAQPTQLSAPEVTIGEDGTVTIGTVANATKIVYVIGDGTETEYDANDKPVLEEGQTIKVTAKGDGTNYSDSAVVEKTRPAPLSLMTHAEFMAAAKGDDVLVQGIVTVISGKNVYFSDNDGGYYAYGVKEVPENLAIGMTVKVSGKKDVYYGTSQVGNGGTLEIVDTEIKDASPVDITEAVTNMTSLDELDAYHNMLVIIKGITLAEFSGSSFKFTLGTVEVTHYVGGRYQVVLQDDQAAYKQLFADNAGKTADLTCIVGATTSGDNVVYQLVPATNNPLSNIKANLTKLTAPTVSVNQTTGIATFVKADGVSYVYKIGEDGTATPVPENGQIQLEKGQTVYVMAKGDGTTTSDSDWSVGKIYSDVDPDTLPALDKPVITVNANGTFSWTAVEGASGYGYVIGDGEEVEVSAATLSVTGTPLTAGQTVKVRALGDMVNNKHSEYAQATYIKKLDAPTVEISPSGVVTVTADENATKVVYVIGDGTETDYDADNKPVLTNGQTIKVTAKGNGTAYSDSAVVEMTFTEIEVISYAVFMSDDTAVGTTVAVTGVVTALRDNKVYFQDTDGGYYAYNAKTVPENLAVGMSVKVVGKKGENKGLTQINEAIVEITNETVTPVTPVDLTTVEITALDELEAYQNRLVVIKGITVAAFSSSYTIKIGNVDVPIYVGGNSQIVDGDGQTAFKKAFNDNIGKTGDFTCIVSIYNTAQLVPANTTPFSNLQGAAICAKPVVTIDDSGLAKWSAVAGAVKYVYKVNDGTAVEITDVTDKEEFSVQLSNNDFIVVQAIGNGTDYSDSDWSEKRTYRQFNVTVGKLVKASASTTLKVGDVIVITNKDATMTLENTPRNNNRLATAFDKDSPSELVTYIILEKGTKENTFWMRTNLGYLYASSSTSNYLVLKEEPDANCDWTITVDASGYASIVCQGEATRNKLQYLDGTTKLFSCYSTTQGAVCVYLNVNTKKLPKPVISIDADGFVTITNYEAIVANTVNNAPAKIYFHIGEDDNDHSNDSIYNPANKPQLNHNETITVTAKGDSIYFDSNFATATYDETDYIVNLVAPTVTIDDTSGIVTITARGDANGNYKDKITGYVYSVLNEDKSEIADKKDLTYDPEEGITLDNKQWIIVKSIGQRRFKDSAYGDPVQFVKTETAKAIATPTIVVDKDGNVSFTVKTENDGDVVYSATAGAGYSYQIKKSGGSYDEVQTATKATGSVFTAITGENNVLKNGDTIKVRANRDTTKELQLDSAWSAELTYYAPSERTEIPTDFAFTKVENQVKLTFTPASGVEYKISLNDGNAVAVENGEHLIAIAAYTSLSVIVVNNIPADPVENGDYRTYFKDKPIDLKETYETTFFNAYAVATVRAEVEALSPATIPTLLEDDTTITLPVAGTAYTNISIDWSITEGGNSTFAYLSEDGKTLTIKPSATSLAFELTLQAVINGDDSDPVTFTINVVKVNAVKFDFSAEKGTASNNTEYKVTELSTSCKDNINFTGATITKVYSYAQCLRIGQKSNSGTLVLTFAQNIEKVILNCGAYDNDSPSSVKVTVNGSEMAGLESTAKDFTFNYETNLNTFTIESDKSFCVYKITVYLKELTDQDKVDIVKNSLTVESSYVNDFVLPIENGHGVTVEWEVTDGASAASIGTDKKSVTITRGSADVTVTVKATLSLNGITGETTRTFTVPANTGKEWTLVTSMEQISDGSKVIISNSDIGTGDGSVALSTQQNTNNRAQTAFDKSNPSSSVQILTVRTGTDTSKFVLAIEDAEGKASGYLYAAGGTGKNNYLKTNATKTAVCDWTIKINANNSASIVAADTTIVRNTMMYNSSASNGLVFACYASGQQPIYMYVLAQA